MKHVIPFILQVYYVGRLNKSLKNLSFYYISNPKFSNSLKEVKILKKKKLSENFLVWIKENEKCI